MNYKYQIVQDAPVWQEDRFPPKDHCFYVQPSPEKAKRPRIFCRFCGEDSLFQTRFQLTDHLAVCHNYVEFSCSICHLVLRSKESLSKHIKLHHIPAHNFGCTQCTQRFRTKNTLNRHVKEIHAPQKTIFQCNVCDKEFTQNCNLLRHIKSKHQKVYSAKVPSYYTQARTNPSWSAQKSSQLVKMPQPALFACQQCVCRFASDEALKRHVGERHTSWRYKCDICSTMLANRESIRAHCLRMHQIILTPEHLSSLRSRPRTPIKKPKKTPPPTSKMEGLRSIIPGPPQGPPPQNDPFLAPVKLPISRMKQEPRVKPVAEPMVLESAHNSSFSSDIPGHFSQFFSSTPLKSEFMENAGFAPQMPVQAPEESHFGADTSFLSQEPGGVEAEKADENVIQAENNSFDSTFDLDFAHNASFMQLDLCPEQICLINVDDLKL